MEPIKQKKVKKNSSKEVIIVVAEKDFRDEEYFVTKEIIEKAGFNVKTASNKIGRAVGADGGDAKIDFLISAINPINFESIIFIGGPGCLLYLDNETSYQLIKETVRQNKLLCAICISPVILAKAGVLVGKKATVWSSPLNKEPIEILKNNGAIYLEQDVVVDGKIVTANGPDASKKFGETIIRLLTK